MIFVYTFAIVFAALVIILGIGSMLTSPEEEKEPLQEGEATAAMCTTQLLESPVGIMDFCDEDFVIEQDMVYTYESVNIL